MATTAARSEEARVLKAERDGEIEVAGPAPLMATSPSMSAQVPRIFLDLVSGEPKRIVSGRFTVYAGGVYAERSRISSAWTVKREGRAAQLEDLLPSGRRSFDSGGEALIQPCATSRLGTVSPGEATAHTRSST